MQTWRDRPSAAPAVTPSRARVRVRYQDAAPHPPCRSIGATARRASAPCRSWAVRVVSVRSIFVVSTVNRASIIVESTDNTRAVFRSSKRARRGSFLAIPYAQTSKSLACGEACRHGARLQSPVRRGLLRGLMPDAKAERGRLDTRRSKVVGQAGQTERAQHAMLDLSQVSRINHMYHILAFPSCVFPVKRE